MWATEKNLPPELLAYRERAELTRLVMAGLVLGSFLALATLIASIGLFFAKAWARETFLLTNIGVAFLPLVFFQPGIASVWAETAAYLHTLLTGGLLFSLYLPPLKELIDKTSEVRE